MGPQRVRPTLTRWQSASRRASSPRIGTKESAKTSRKPTSWTGRPTRRSGSSRRSSASAASTGTVVAVNNAASVSRLNSRSRSSASSPGRAMAPSPTGQLARWASKDQARLATATNPRSHTAAPKPRPRTPTGTRALAESRDQKRQHEELCARHPADDGGQRQEHGGSQLGARIQRVHRRRAGDVTTQARDSRGQTRTSSCRGAMP